MKWFTLIAAFVLFAQSGVSQGAAFAWPAVRSLDRTFDITDAPNADILVPISGEEDKSLYMLRCLGEQKFRTDPTFDHSGDFECRLNSTYTKDKYYSTLLTYDPMQERGWESRGRFLAWPDLTGSCAEYPEYGRLRHFQLRGMKLTLELSEIHISKDGTRTPESGGLKLDSFKFRVRVEPDPTAYSTIAGPVPIEEPDPPRIPCDRVLVKHVPGGVESSFISQNRLQPPFPAITPARGEGVLPGRNSDFVSADKPLPTAARAFYLPIHGTDGRLLYEFECSSTDPIVRYGISCGFFEHGRKINLLSDSTDAYSRLDRSTVLPEQLEGKCADYPDWGAQRVFSLRGMKLVVHLQEPEFIPSVDDRSGRALKKIRIVVDVAPDPSSSSPVAAPPHYAAWEAFPQANPCEIPVVNPWASGRN